MDKTTEEELTYAEEGVPLMSSEETEHMRGGTAAAGGAAGTGSNIPTHSNNNANGSGSSNDNRTKTDTEMGVGKKVRKTEVAPGAVNKLNVALIADKSIPAADFASLQDTVATAAGLDQTTRGDTLTAMQVAFAKAETRKAGPVPTTLLGPLKWVGLGLASLLFLRFVAQEYDDLLGRHGSQELERTALDRGRDATDDLVRDPRRASA